ncbi:hypothetical protein ABVT39_016424 [Epinephelus coioides]
MRETERKSKKSPSIPEIDHRRAACVTLTHDETSPRRPVPAAHYTAVGASLSARADRKTCCFYSKPQNLELCVPPQHVGYLTRQRRPEIRGSVNLKSLNRRMKKKDRTI